MTLSHLGPGPLLLVALAVAAAPASGRGDIWRYVAPGPGEPFEHPPLRAVALSPDRPEGLQENLRYRGKKQRYAQICYGSTATVRVAIVLDEISDDEADLYVDARRCRVLDPGDRVVGKSGTWYVSLDALTAGDRPESAQRTVLFRLGRVGRTLSLATCGYLEGKVPIGDRLVTVRRVDGDGNGLFADPQDRLWIDLAGKGAWDALDDQFLYNPILSLAGTRYAVHSDPLGKRLAFHKLEGTGAVRIVPRQTAVAERIEDMTATLTGRDGSVFTLHGRDARAILPVGVYRLSVLSLTLKDSRGGPPWTFVFSDNGGKPRRHWHTLEKDGQLVLDPVGKLEMLAVLNDEDAICRPGQALPVQPRLYTEEGLLIATAFRGAPDAAGRSGGCAALVNLTTKDGQSISSYPSGFA
jgi:hypothetical protein